MPGLVQCFLNQAIGYLITVTDERNIIMHDLDTLKVAKQVILPNYWFAFLLKLYRCVAQKAIDLSSISGRGEVLVCRDFWKFKMWLFAQIEDIPY